MTTSIEKSIRTYKVAEGYAPNYQSHRFLDSHATVCPTWTGKDLLGRDVHSNSFMTKSAGCNSASERVSVESDHRPQYFHYINLSADGVTGNASGPMPNYSVASNEYAMHGGFGQQLHKHLEANTHDAYGKVDSVSVMNYHRRKEAMAAAHNLSAARRQSSGFWY